MLAGVILLAGARWCAFSGDVPKTSVVLAGVVGCPRVVGVAAAVISGVRVVAVSGLRAVVGP